MNFGGNAEYTYTYVHIFKFANSNEFEKIQITENALFNTTFDSIGREKIFSRIRENRRIKILS